jgi:hypothetical protein
MFAVRATCSLPYPKVNVETVPTAELKILPLASPALHQGNGLVATVEIEKAGTVNPQRTGKSIGCGKADGAVAGEPDAAELKPG